MASIDFGDRLAPAAGPRFDRLGFSLFFFHLLISAYVLLGWTTPSPTALLFYLLLLPAIALQWHINRGCCVINNLESWLRSGRVRDPENKEEGAFLLMLSNWLFRSRPHPLFLNRFSYGTVLILWLLAFSHFLLARDGLIRRCSSTRVFARASQRSWSSAFLLRRSTCTPAPPTRLTARTKRRMRAAR